MRRAQLCFVLALAFAFSPIPAADLPEGDEGIAARYPGDLDIANDPAVVFREDFEEALVADMKARWENLTDNGMFSFSAQKSASSEGDASLLITHIGGQGTGGSLYRRFLPGYGELYYRFYVRFDSDCWRVHHSTTVGGHNPSTPWPQGTAGIMPDGTDFCTTAIEPRGTDWRWDFYTYWPEMTPLYGNSFINDPQFSVPRDEWICVEVMMKLNEPVTSRNGEHAVWINGELLRKDGQVVSHAGPGFPRGSWQGGNWHPDPAGSPFEGFRWRTTTDLNINFLWLYAYISDAPTGHISKIWFDDIVVASSYIGPVSPVPEPVNDEDIRRSDFDGSGKVGFEDFLEFVGHFGKRQGQADFDSVFDLNDNGAVDFSDFLVFVSVFGRTVTA